MHRQAAAEHQRALSCLGAAMRRLGLFAALIIGLTAAVPVAAVEGPGSVVPGQKHPLRPADTSSPRATLFGFLDDGNAAWRAALQSGIGPGDPSKPESRGHGRVPEYLDLSEVPPAQQEDIGLETGILLLDVLNRVALPPSDEVPDAPEMKRDERTVWTMPHTSIAIVRIEDGERAGEWLFSAKTIARVREYYRLTRHLPVKPDAAIEDGFRVFIATPGWLIPGHWVINLPPWAQQVYLEQTVWQWGLLTFTLLVAALLARAALRWSRTTTSPGPVQRPSTRRALAGPLSLVLLSSVALYVIDGQINVSGTVLAVLRFVLDAAFYLAAAWAVILAGRVVTQAILGSNRVRPDSLDAQLLRIGVIVADVVIIFVIAVIWAQSMGIPILAMLTGLGVGGIAVALAAQRTIENFFGSLMLFADRPVHIGDFCRFGDKMGTVERVGLRSTRIRTLERSILTVPNAEFSRSQIENLASRDRLLLQTLLNLRLETTTEQIEHVLYRVRGILLGREDVDHDAARVELVAVGPLSIDLEIFAYITTSDWNRFLAIRRDIYLEILRAVKDVGTALAPPAQIQYHDSAKPIETAAEEPASD